MKPQTPVTDAFDLFQAHFDQPLNPNHPLIGLAKQIDCESFDAAYGELYCEHTGAPAKATRLMVGLHYLKHTFNESDESVVERWVENPYWQYFCGYTHMQHELPIHPTSMTRWRQRIGAQKLTELLAHAKHEHRMNRCYLKGLEGDAMNVILATAAANLRKLLRLLPCATPIRLLVSLLRRFQAAITPPAWRSPFATLPQAVQIAGFSGTTH